MSSRKDAQLNKAGPKLFYGYVVVFAAFVIMLLVFGVHYAFGVFLKPMIAEFGWGRAVTSGAYSLSWLLQGPSAIVMGRLNDRHGPRAVLTLSAILLSAGILLTTRIHAEWHLYLTYGMFMGIGTGGVFVPLVSTIARWFIGRRGAMTGMAVSGMGLGTFLLSPLANFLISVYSWRTSYTILGIALLLVVLFAAQFLRRDPELMGQLPYGHHETLENPLQGKNSVFSLKEATLTREFWIVFSMFFCFGVSLLGVLVHIVPHATDIGKSTATAAGLVSIIGIASIAGKVLLGGLGDKTGHKVIYLIGFSMMTASILWLTPARESWLLYLFAIVFGLAYGGNASSQSPLVATLFGLQSHGIIMGTVNNGFTAGATLGPVVSGFLFDRTGNYRTAFVVTAAFCIVGLILTTLLKPVKAKGRVG